MDDVQRLYRHVVVRGLAAGAHEPFLLLTIPPGASAAQRAGDAAEQIDALFEQYPGFPAVTVCAEESVIGTATREHSGSVDPHAGVGASTSPYRYSGGDRAILTGQSQRYEVSRYICPGCSRKLYTVAPTAPACPLCNLDGEPMP
jgi:hypothetical protein